MITLVSVSYTHLDVYKRQLINKYGYLLEAIPLEQSNYEINQKGLIVDVYDELTQPINKFPNYKTNNAKVYVMAGLFQKHNRLDEAIILNLSLIHIYQCV